MSRRNLILILVFIGVVLVMMVSGNVIIVAQKLAQATHFPALEYIIYVALALVGGYIFVLPVVRIHTTPELPALSVESNDDAARLRVLAKALAKNMGYIADSRLRDRHRDEFLRRVAMAGYSRPALAEAVEAEIMCRLDGNEGLGVTGMNRRVRDWATSTFIITALSQNGKFDTLSVIYLNLRMISDIVKAAGFRPNRRQLFRLYGNVLLTSLMTFMLSGALEDTGDFAPFASLGEADVDAADVASDSAADVAADASADDGGGFSLFGVLRKINIPAPVIGSALDGAANALMTMRIGYITVSYITEGAAAFKGMQARRRIKRAAMTKAFSGLPSVVAGGSSVVGKGVVSLVLKMYGVKKEEKA